MPVEPGFLSDKRVQLEMSLAYKAGRFGGCGR